MGRLITLKACDGKLLEVEEEVLLQSDTLRPLVLAGRNIIPMPKFTSKITSATLDKVIHFCRHYHKPGWSNAQFLGDLGALFLGDLGNLSDAQRFDYLANLSPLVSAAEHLRIDSLRIWTGIAFCAMLTGLPFKDKFEREYWDQPDLHEIFRLSPSEPSMAPPNNSTRSD
ncbi:hypothetical protein L7F22_039547 [Adiantum nelumboides]|nr:hypothetical protein [Adiantum nelumboides]